MSERGVPPAGSIYDLGYRPYDGGRLGRQYAIATLFLYSLRSAFGIGRSTMAKVFPWLLAAIAYVPAIVQLAIAAVVPADFEAIRPAEYLDTISIVVALFCAVVAPELVGRDQLNRTLPLYFSRALSRDDYVLAKTGALVAAILLVIIVPQLLLLIGSAVAAGDLVDYLQDNIDRVGPIAAGGIAMAVTLATISLAIAAYAPRRALATGAILGFLVITGVVTAVLVETTTGDVQKYVVLAGLPQVLSGFIFWVFDAQPTDQTLLTADLDGVFYLLGTMAYAAVAAALLVRRFRKLAA